MIKSRERKAYTEGNEGVLFLAECFTVESKHYIMDTLVLQNPRLRDTIRSGHSQPIWAEKDKYILCAIMGQVKTAAHYHTKRITQPTTVS